MKKQFTILLMIITFFVAGCSKDKNTIPNSDLKGTWKVTTESTVYLNLDGSSFRDKVITEDDVDTNPVYDIVITEDVVIVDGETATYKISKNTITLTAEGESLTFNYTVKGSEMTWINTELNHFVKYDGPPNDAALWGTTVPKQVLTMTMTRK